MNLRADPRLQIAENYPLHFEQRILYSDMDAYRHLNNGATIRYFEEGRSTVSSKIFGVEAMIDPPNGLQLLIANLTIDFLRQAHYPGVAMIASSLSRVGNSSYVLAHAAFQNGNCFALSEGIIVKAFDGRPAPLTDEERAITASLMLAG